MSEKFLSAVNILKPNTEMTFGGEIETEEDYNNVLWVTGVDEFDKAIQTTDCPHSEITWTLVKAEMDKLEAEYDAQDYARKREAEYPSVQDLVVALYDTDDKTAIDEKRAEIKLKYPKP